AREAGFSSWPRMKHHIQQSALSKRDLEEVVIAAALAGNDTAVHETLARDPVISRRSIYVAAVLADAEAALALLQADPSLADRPGGRRNWRPLLYLCCSRYRRKERDATLARLEIVRRLVQLHADVNATGIEPGYSADNVTVFDEHKWLPVEGAA